MSSHKWVKETELRLATKTIAIKTYCYGNRPELAARRTVIRIAMDLKAFKEKSVILVSHILSLSFLPGKDLHISFFFLLQVLFSLTYLTTWQPGVHKTSPNIPLKVVAYLPGIIYEVVLSVRMEQKEKRISVNIRTRFIRWVGKQLGYKLYQHASDEADCKVAYGSTVAQK